MTQALLGYDRQALAIERRCLWRRVWLDPGTTDRIQHVFGWNAEERTYLVATEHAHGTGCAWVATIPPRHRADFDGCEFCLVRWDTPTW